MGERTVIAAAAAAVGPPDFHRNRATETRPSNYPPSAQADPTGPTERLEE
jgi:hypothetical protein